MSVNPIVLARMIARNIRYRPFSRLIHYARSGGLKPQKISFPGRVMPRAFRRGYGLGGLLRRRPKRRFGRRVYRKKTQNKVHTYVRWCDKDAQYPGDTGPNTILASNVVQNLAYSFKLDNVVNASDFTNLYDQYRINKIHLYLERQLNQSGTVTVGNPSNKRIRVVWDQNDNNPLTQEDDYLEYGNCKSYQILGNGSIRLTIYPRVNNKVEGVGGGDAFTSMPASKQWFNIAEDDIPMFGCKIFIPADVATFGQQLFSVRAKFYLSMKTSK